MKQREVSDLEFGLWRLFLRSRLFGMVLLASIVFVPWIGIDRRVGWLTLLSPARKHRAE